ncbi:hypothetical protein BDR07DRAFT_1486259 [Suillus spraguei]|nr:hypothetical protein BDR07DRAFT_1486259 [Suillus spraguei]
MYSDSKLTFLKETFRELSQKFVKIECVTCATFTTTELPREKAACLQRLAQLPKNTTSPDSNGLRAKKLNLGTYKFHVMGDYMRTIKLFRLTDSFTTQMGELAHKALKAFYPLTSKLDTQAQLAKHEHRCHVLQCVSEVGAILRRPSPHCNQSEQSGLFILIPSEHDGDLVVKNFVPKLKDHILYRLWKLDVTYCNHTFMDKKHNSVIIPNNIIYSVQTMQVNYTTYDLMHEHDTINPQMHADVMVLLGEITPNHPYWYARILGIYHMETWLNVGGQPAKRHLEVLWVTFVKESDPNAFGFLNPSQVIRGAHLIPTFASGHGTSSLHYGKLLACSVEELDDWEELYMGIFADHNMFMQYTPFGVTDTMNTVDDTNHEELADGDEGHEQFDDEDESSDELEDEGDGMGRMRMRTKMKTTSFLFKF